jgi:hypothetical protein
MFGEVAFGEHNAVDFSVWKNPRLYARVAAWSSLKTSAKVCGNPAVSFIASRHDAHCCSARQHATPPIVVVVVVAAVATVVAAVVVGVPTVVVVMAVDEMDVDTVAISLDAISTIHHMT